MTITQSANTAGAFAGLRVGPGITLQFAESLTVGAGAKLTATVIYTFGGTPWTMCFGVGFATPGAGGLSNVTIGPVPSSFVTVGVPDGAAVVVTVIYSAAGGALIESATFAGYTWDGLTGLTAFLIGASSSPLSAILQAVSRTYVSP